MSALQYVVFCIQSLPMHVLGVLCCGCHISKYQYEFFPSMFMPAYTSHTSEAKAGGLQVPGLPALLSEILSEKRTF